MATTTNYGWATPDDTALVKDGASAIRTLGSSVDTTTKNLNPETTLGDLSFRSSTSNVNTRIPIGSSGQHLTVVAGVPAWSTASDQTPLTTKGDLLTFDTADARLGVGANDTILVADSSTSTGLKWAAPAAGGGFTLLSTTTASGATFTISSISGAHKHLFITGKNFKTDANDLEMGFRFNADTGSNYNYVMQRSENTTYSTGIGNNATSLSSVISINNESTAQEMTQFSMWVYNYTSTDNVTGLINSKGAGFTGGASTRTQANTFFNYDCAAAITSMTIFTGGGEYAGGQVLIFGVN